MCHAVSLLESLAQHKKPLFVLGKVFCAILIGGGAKGVQNTLLYGKKRECYGKQFRPLVKFQFWDVYEFSTDQI